MRRGLLLVLFGIGVMFFLGFVNALPSPIVHYSFNPANGTYNSTFLEDLSGNGRNISGSFPGTINTLRTGYFSYSNGSGSTSNFIVPSFSSVTSNVTDITFDFYIDRATYTQNYLWNLNVPAKTYNSSGSVIAASPVIAIYLSQSNNKLMFGTSSASTGYLNITVPELNSQDHIAIRIRNGTVSVFHEGSYLGDMSSDVGGTYPWNTNISTISVTSLKMLSGTTSGTTYIGYQTGDFKFYNTTASNEDLINITSYNTVKYLTEGLVGYYSLNSSMGIYNSTFLEDLSGESFNATKTGSSTYTLTNLSNSNNIIYEKNDGLEDGFNPSIPGLIANDKYITYDFYADLDQRNTWFVFWKGTYTYNDSLTSSSNFLITRESVSGSKPAGTVRVNFQSLGYAEADLVVGKRFSHIILHFNGSNYQFYQDGYKLNMNFTAGLTGNILQSLSLTETKLISGKNSSSYDTRTLGPIKIYRAMEYTDEDLEAMSLENELENFDNAIDVLFPHNDNVVVQRDIVINKGNLTIEFSNYFNARKMNVTISGYSPVEIDIVNQSSQNYTFENLDPGCYNITLQTNINSRNITNYCVGEVIVIQGQSNSMMYGDGFNYSKVGVNLTSNHLVMAYTVPNPNHQYHVMHIANYFNSSNTTWYAGIWAPLAFNISNELNMPVMVYDIGVGGTPITEFINGYAREYMDWNNDYVMKYDHKAAFIIWMQGEADETTSNYTDYLAQLTGIWNEMYDLQYENKYMLAIPGNYQASTDEVCPVPTIADKSWAQYSMFNLVYQNSSYYVPSVILDIETNNIQNCIHMADVEFDALQFAMRVKDGIMTYVYNKSYLDRPNITDIFIYNETTLGIKYDRLVKFENSHGVAGLVSEGFRLYDSETGDWYDAGNITNSNLVSSRIVSNNFVLNFYNTSILNMAEVSFCARQIDCYNRSIARSSTSSFPTSDMATPIYRQNLEINESLICEAKNRGWSNGVCYSSFSISPQNTSYINRTQLVNISSVGESTWYNWDGINYSYSSPINVIFAEGSNTLIVYSNDSLGAVNSSNVTFYIDSIVPTITLLSPINSYSETSSSSTINFQFNVSDESEITNCTLYLNGVGYSNTSVVNKSAFNTISVSSISSGSYSWYVNCTDSLGNSGNSSTNSFSIVEPTVTSSGTSSSILYVSTQSLASGYNRILISNWQIRFSLGNESHSLYLNNVSNKSATFTVSSAPQIITLNIGEERKLSLTNSSYYDLYVRLNSIYQGKANFTIKSINETISIVSVPIVQNNTITEIVSEKNESNLRWYLPFGLIVIGLVIFIIYRISRGRVRFWN